jgi:hypothetical protein
MKENQIFIPKKLKVGYQKRSDTYSKKLAYVTYYDQKNKLRKEGSWKGWIDEKVGIDEFENVPTEGFVLNRNVGGVKESYGSYDVRIEKVRVYDPRGFEFEIDIPNVLTILQECTSVKGKGLEGEFVYGWAGANLILIPTSCQQYKESQEYTDLQSTKISAKELIPGCSYKTKKQKDLIYLGKMNWFDYKYNDSQVFESKIKFVFVDEKPDNFGDDYEPTPEDFETDEEYQEEIKRLKEDREREEEEIKLNGEEIQFVSFPSISNLAVCNSDVPVSNYAELMDRFNSTKYAAKPVSFVEEKEIVLPEINKQYSWWNIDLKRELFEKVSDKKYSKLRFGFEGSCHNESKPENISCSRCEDYVIDKNGSLKKDWVYGSGKTKNFKSMEEIKKFNFVHLSVLLDNNKTAKIEQY